MGSVSFVENWKCSNNKRQSSEMGCLVNGPLFVDPDEWTRLARLLKDTEAEAAAQDGEGCLGPEGIVGQQDKMKDAWRKVDEVAEDPDEDAQGISPCDTGKMKVLKVLISQINNRKKKLLLLQYGRQGQGMRITYWCLSVQNTAMTADVIPAVMTYGRGISLRRGTTGDCCRSSFGSSEMGSNPAGCLSRLWQEVAAMTRAHSKLPTRGNKAHLLGAGNTI